MVVSKSIQLSSSLLALQVWRPPGSVTHFPLFSTSSLSLYRLYRVSVLSLFISGLFFSTDGDVRRVSGNLKMYVPRGEHSDHMS